MTTKPTMRNVSLDDIATKEDLQRELHAMTWKIISAIAALVAAVYFIAK